MIGFPRYGLGTCYLRMSKIRLAEYHYRKAVEIHPNNAVLLGCVGMASTTHVCGDQVELTGPVNNYYRLLTDVGTAMQPWPSLTKLSGLHPITP